MGGLYGILIQAALVVFIAAGAWLYGYGKGGDATRTEYAARDLQAASEAQIAYAGIVERNRAKEQAWAKSFSRVSQGHQKELADNAKALDIALASGRLYDKFAANLQASGSACGPVASSASGGDGGRGTELSNPLTEFLVREASRADKIVLQLTSCQAILRSERDYSKISDR